MVALMSTAIVIYFGEWIKSVIPINLIVLLLLVYVVYIGIRCYVKDWREERGYYLEKHREMSLSSCVKNEALIIFI